MDISTDHNMGIRSDAIKLIREKKVSMISESDKRVAIEVDKDVVIFQKRNGRTQITCSCRNHAQFCVENPLCKHKLAAIFLWTWEGMK